MRTKRYLGTLNNLIAAGSERRSTGKILADKRRMTVEQYGELPINIRQNEFKEFKADIPYIRAKLRRMEIKLLTDRGNGEMYYSVNAKDNPDQIEKQFIKDKKRAVNLLRWLDIDVNFIEELKHLSQQRLLPFKIDKSTKLQHFLGEPDESNGGNKKNVQD